MKKKISSKILRRNSKGGTYEVRVRDANYLKKHIRQGVKIYAGDFKSLYPFMSEDIQGTLCAMQLKLRAGERIETFAYYSNKVVTASVYNGFDRVAVMTTDNEHEDY